MLTATRLTITGGFLALLLFGSSVNVAALSPPPPEIHIITFGTDSASIDAAGRKVIDRIVSDVRANYGDKYQIAVTGHADTTGPADYNLALSLKRAEAVRDALVAAGIPRDTIATAKRGETEPVVPTADGVSESANRRVEVIVQ